jgi:hypothetical protein
MGKRKEQPGNYELGPVLRRRNTNPCSLPLSANVPPGNPKPGDSDDPQGKRICLRSSQPISEPLSLKYYFTQSTASIAMESQEHLTVEAAAHEVTILILPLPLSISC